jgi:putative MATE family efflux protein
MSERPIAAQVPFAAEDPASNRASRRRRIVGLALPITIAGAAQNLMIVIDTIMVGQLDKAALASVGATSFMYLALVSSAIGIQQGVQVMVARRRGEGRSSETTSVLNAALLIGALAGLALMAFGYVTLPALNSLLFSDPAVVQLGNSYLRMLIPAIFPACLYFAFDGYWLGSGRAKISMVCFLVLAFLNALFNYALIFGKFGLPGLGAPGSGLGSSLAAFAVVAMLFAIAWTLLGRDGFMRRLPDSESFRTLFRLCFSIGIGGLLKAIGAVAFLSLVGLLGTASLAACTILVRIMTVLGILVGGVGSAAATLVSEALGQGHVKVAARLGWESAIYAAAIAALVGLITILPFSEAVLGLFTQDAGVVQLAKVPLMILALTVVVDGFVMSMLQAFIGAGAGTFAMVFSVSAYWFVRLPLNWFWGVHLGNGLTGMFLNGLCVALASAILVAIVWQRGRWASLKI